MPRDTPERRRQYRGSKTYKESWHDSRTNDRISHRSSYDKSRRDSSRSRSPYSRSRKHDVSKSRSRSPSRTRRHYHRKSRSRSTSRYRKRSPSRSRSRSQSRYRKQGNKSRKEDSLLSVPHSKQNSSITRHIVLKSEDIVSRNNYERRKESCNWEKTRHRETYHAYNGFSNLDDNTNSNGNRTDDDDAAGNYIPDELEPIDKEKIHKQIEEKLRLALAKEGKVYPPPKPEASHPVFANDGSFLEVFKKLQEQAKQTQQTENAKAAAKPLCKRRGGKILKTGIVSKPKTENSSMETDPKDFWAIYLQEVKKYKSASCDMDSKTRPLVK